MNSNFDEQHFTAIWDQKIQLNKTKEGVNIRVEKALKSLEKGTFLLDIGCGDGSLCAHAKTLFKETYGVDISETAIEIALQRGVKAQVVNLNRDPLPFPDHYFDTVTCLATMQYLFDLEKAVKEFRKVLRPGKFLIINVPNMRTYWRIVKIALFGLFPRTSLDSIGWDGGVLHYFCTRNIVDLLSNNGFEILNTYGIYCLPKFFNRLPDQGLFGTIKREFFAAEIIIKARANIDNG